MTEIRIVDYHRKYVASLAKMWNMSADSWGGFGTVVNEEQVIQENEGTENINIWLALAGDEVVGYCTFSEYREDEGASYIPLLNVRPDFHGKKVGKLLVLKAVERACQLGWPRLDLYTWPGNTKAVPLYKKCGFFWEDRDDTTHLMNFIPYVMQTEAVADFFEQADWYRDSVRPMKVEPDGRKERGFEYLTYQWQHDGRSLRMEFERRGRGLRLIETDDWLVEATVEDLNLVFGREYKIMYRLVNKSGRPLVVDIQGRDDKNISFALSERVAVEKEAIVEGTFKVGEIQEEQNIWRTHPAVVADIAINGKGALFKVGIVPKFPALIKAVVPDKECFAGSKGEFYLNIENCFREPAAFSFVLPSGDCVHLGEKEFQVRLAPREKRALKVPYVLDRPGMWRGKLEITATPEGGNPIVYFRELSAVFTGVGACFGGETDDHWVAAMGRFVLKLSKFNNQVEVWQGGRAEETGGFLRPQLGQPYSAEFTKRKPEQVKFAQEEGAIVLRAHYRSQVITGVELVRIVRLQADGLVEQRWQVANRGQKPVELWLKEGVSLNMRQAVYPLAGRYMETRGDWGAYPGSFSMQKLTENWVFSQSGTPQGICWPEGLKPTTDYKILIFQHQLGRLAVGQVTETRPVFMAVGTFSDWRDFRRFARRINQGADLHLTESLELAVNNGNPFVEGAYGAVVREHKKTAFAGQVKVGGVAHKAIGQGELEYSLQGPAAGTIGLVSMEADLEALYTRSERVVFGTGGQVSVQRENRDGREFLLLDNGIVTMSAAPDYANTLCQLEYRGVPWLANSFPTTGTRSWWNPWVGGITVTLNDLGHRSLLKEKRAGDFVRLEDAVGNIWQGIALTYPSIEHSEKYRGLELRQYYLTLPGLAGLCTLVEFYQQDCGVLADVAYDIDAFLAPGGDVQGCWFETECQDGSMLRFKQASGHGTIVDNKIVAGCHRVKEQLLLYRDGPVGGYLNKEIAVGFVDGEKVTLVPGKQLRTKPLFMFFVQDNFSRLSLRDVDKIRF